MAPVPSNVAAPMERDWHLQIPWTKTWANLRRMKEMGEKMNFKLAVANPHFWLSVTSVATWCNALFRNPEFRGFCVTKVYEVNLGKGTCAEQNIIDI